MKGRHRLFCVLAVLLFVTWSVLNKSKRGFLTCSPKTKLGYSKNHKAASTTVQNVILRFVMKNELNVVLPESKNILGLGVPFSRRMIIGTPWEKAGISYDVFALHTTWNHKAISSMLGPEATYITILREPATLFVSLWDYMELQRVTKMTLSQFVELTDAERTATMMRNNIRGIGRNQMLLDLGLSPLFHENVEAVQHKIKEIDNNFDLVMIAERFDESMILMKELLCWDFSDVEYLKLNRRNSATQKNHLLGTTMKRVQEKLKNWLRADYMLYEHFLRKFDEEYIPKIMKGKNMSEETNILKKRNSDLFNKCVKDTYDESFKVPNPLFRLFKQHLVSYDVKEECKYYSIKENYFIDQVREMQEERAKNIYNGSRSS